MIRASSRALSTQAQVLVDDELADTGVAGSNDGKANDDSYFVLDAFVCDLAGGFRITEGHQLKRDLLELAETLGDSVAYIESGRGSDNRL